MFVLPLHMNVYIYTCTLICMFVFTLDSDFLDSFWGSVSDWDVYFDRLSVRVRLMGVCVCVCVCVCDCVWLCIEMENKETVTEQMFFFLFPLFS